ncbi:pimeloyl-ACP methyl ester carboxylesterase [Bartonella fuyuanensis]|uniref:Pimeloyl-ACP methyl ester carboxylesterase n=1 Tax=Bartonella fuyuanensis TaxID=1460968 RepID=A0A840DV09_9HYPH|nr:alpha/beta hydrolase [Bartonella fuyuanensis]MBB4076954.1 pimeloyl-ACP methyl ester carboxylesterase [Bartonella fuyuanensis]
MNFHSVILAPVMSVWDKGAFCSSLKSLFLERGFRVTLLDTLSLFSSNSTIEVIPSLIAELQNSFREPFILVGFAMAGTLVQMLAAKLPHAQAVLAVNAPGYPDKLLQQRLGYLLTLLKSGDLSGALEILDAFVQPIGAIKKRTLLEISDEQKSMAIERMTRGFKLLLEMDARNEIIKYTGKFLALVGEKSQLATVENQTRSHCMNHEYKIVSGAGMRLWEDNPTMTDAVIDEWIDKL